MSLAASLCVCSAALAEVSEVRVARQYGIAYLQLMFMEHHKLIEKQARAAGLPELKASWVQLTDGVAVNDALLSGNLDFAGGGTGAFVTLWGRTRGTLDVKAVGALCAMPMLLNTRNPNVKSVRDFTDKDRIALPGVKVSPQATTLQLAAAQAFGDANWARLDALTVNMAHPVGMQALLSGQAEITAHLTAPPYQYQELEKPGIRTVFNSYDVWGGPQTIIVVWATSKFRDANPRVAAAFSAALEEATAMINRDKRAAAELYLQISRDKDSVDAIHIMLLNPQVEYSMVPKNLMKFVDFKHKIGAIKVKPDSWKDLFFSNVHNLPGS